jgi:hypothetical protein
MAARAEDPMQVLLVIVAVGTCIARTALISEGPS